MKKYLCIHGHFYQPPRENPWLEAVELQESAFPYHDWNERINAECYAPNAFARILDGEGRIVDVVNNYSRISFDFGPTLLAWLDAHAPEVLAAIQEADKASRGRFSGHGSALAQAYNHTILPLCNLRDKRTQVAWGIRDFEHRFGRHPEGMWLPECAADTESLEVLAEAGIRFTILSPFQASKVRRLDEGDWSNVNGGRIDPSCAYQVNLPSGRHLAVFFYDAPVAKAVAFEQLLTNGETFATRLLEAYGEEREGNRLMNIATDGESYGHHHRYGEMALAYALQHIETHQLAQLTNYGEFLEQNPPVCEVQIHEQSAWSCSHGVRRWHSDCGCNSGGRPGWNQRWRQPLRDALDWLRDQLAPAYAARAKEFFKDPWQARDHYIAVILDRSPENLARFFQAEQCRELADAEWETCLGLLELQRHALLMFTSCGWFFDELSGIETVQIIQYAARAIQLAQMVLGRDFQPDFLNRLALARSNIPEHRDGAAIYKKFVQPAMVDREHLGAHFAVSSLFKDYPEQVRIYDYTLTRRHQQKFETERARLIVGCAEVISNITRGHDVFSYAAMCSGNWEITCAMRSFLDDRSYHELLETIGSPFEQGDFRRVREVMDRCFGGSYYSLNSLFRDEQNQIVNQIFAAAGRDVEDRLREISGQFAPLVRLLNGIGARMPVAVSTVAAFVLHTELRRILAEPEPDLPKVRALLEQARLQKIDLRDDALAHSIKARLDHRLEQLTRNPDDLAFLTATADLAQIVCNLNLEMNLLTTQSLLFKLLKNIAPERRTRAQQGDAEAGAWMQEFARLGQQLGFQVQGVSA